ncbi:MAG: hypothetical protein JXR77_00645, partial [Lentisphaeria bacterium]|nr:hypothetical protein [Lentisphaeria bacterium]
VCWYGEDLHLSDIVRLQAHGAPPLAGTIDVRVPRRGSRPARDAKVGIRFAPVVPEPPKASGLPPVSVRAVHAREGGCVAGVTPLEWMLLTTVPTATFEQARETPHASCTLFLSESEWKVLWALTTRKGPPDQAPELQTAVRAIGKLGGYLGRKCDGEPGTVTVARGLAPARGHGGGLPCRRSSAARP